METPLDLAAKHYGNGAALAKALNVSQSFITQVRKGQRKLPMQHALQIDRDTRGAVSAADLRADVDWRRGRDISSPQQQASV